jgi:hypothetical protein
MIRYNNPSCKNCAYVSRSNYDERGRLAPMLVCCHPRKCVSGERYLARNLHNYEA